MNMNTNTAGQKRQGFLRMVTVVLAMLALTFTSGCLAVAAGAGAAGAVAWVRGELRATVAGSYDNTVAASNRAITQMEFAKISERRDTLKAIIVARTADDKKIEINVEKVSNEVTDVKIRVGVFGDERVSLMILDKIKANL
ncbi:MAG: DUF3568 family protein [Verrucomicrobia bacterium]|nr:DUF3568 family protein [Verrucomicrobiota bacterium]